MSRIVVSAVLTGALALAGATLPTWAATKPALAPVDFLKNAVVADNGEIALARLAQRRADRPEVRAFARLIAEDHTHTRQQAADLMRAAGRPAVEGVSDDAQAELHKLRALSGRSFDREFVRYMAEDHRRDVREYRAQAARRQGRASRLAQMAVPILRKHLRMAETLAPQVGLRDRAEAKTD